MRHFIPYILIVAFWAIANSGFAQPLKEIFIPLDLRSELRIEPQVDTLEEGKDYRFIITLDPNFKIAQSFFDKGLATLQDSILTIRAKASKPRGAEKSMLRFIITNLQNTRILLMKEYTVKSDGRLYPLVAKPKTNIIKLNDLQIERNKTYNKKEFADKPFVQFYENEYSDTSKRINGVKMTFVKGDYQKHFASSNDTLSLEMLREIKKIRGNTTVFLSIEIPQPRKKVKNIWSRFTVTD